MQNLSDEDIDKLFKRAAEQQQSQFDSADWDNMASRLDASKRPWLNYYTLTGSLVLLGVVVWLGWFISKPTEPVASEMTSSVVQNEAQVNPSRVANEANTTQPVENVQSLSSERKGYASLNSSSEKNKAVDGSIKNTSNVTKAVTQKSGKTKTNVVNATTVAETTTASLSRSHSSSASSDQFNQNELTNPSSKEKDNVMNTVNSSTEDSNENLQSNTDLKASDELKPIGRAESIGATSVSVNGTTEIRLQENAGTITSSDQNAPGKQSSRVNQSNSEVGIDSVNKVTTEEKLEKKVNTSPASSEENSVEPKPIFSRLAMKVTVAPDFSSDQFKSPDKMGFNFGLMVEYFLNKNISVTTGALWSRKYYTANEVDYNGYHADRAYGDCRMWDIPVNINYYFTPSKRFSFFASAGLSSYLMNEENYDYEVDTNYGTKTYYSQVIKENKEWFKTLNVSVGLQKQVGSRFAIQVEPFVKVPLSGVGEGNISLASFGGFFSVRYNLLTLKK